MKWQSIAEWPFMPNSMNAVTTDSHRTKEEALAVIRLLEKEGFGGEGLIFPVKVYIKENNS